MLTRYISCTYTPSLSYPSLNILKNIPKPLPHLLATGQNLRRRQHKATIPRIAQLNRHAVISFRNLGSVIDAIAANLVNGVANGPTGEGGAVHGFDGSDGAVGQGGVFGGVGDGAGARVAVGVHPELAVGVDVHVELDALAGGEAVELRLEGFGFHAVAGRGSLVVLVAGRGASAATLVPVVGPVAVDVAADTAGGGCCLAVLAPQTIVGLRVREAVWVDDGENVVVPAVSQSNGSRISRSEKLIGGIFVDLGELVQGYMYK